MIVIVFVIVIVSVFVIVIVMSRPVYKQDGGENYVYYSLAGQSWLVGCLVGHTHGWLRNRSQGAATSRYPSLLTTGWEVRQEAGGWTGADQDIVSFENIKGIKLSTYYIKTVPRKCNKQEYLPFGAFTL